MLPQETADLKLNSLSAATLFFFRPKQKQPVNLQPRLCSNPEQQTFESFISGTERKLGSMDKKTYTAAFKVKGDLHSCVLKKNRADK